MDNDNQVKDRDNQVKDRALVAKEIFLEEAEQQETKAPKLYSVEEEFAKSRENRSLRVFFIVLGFVIVSAAGTLGLTMYIENNNRRIPVDIKDFEDVNLKDILSTAKKNETDLADAQRALADLDQEITAAQLVVRDDITRQIQIIGQQDLSSDEEKRQVDQLRGQEKRRLDAITAQYAPRRRQMVASVSDLQAKVDAFDQRSLEAARKQEEVLNNQQKLHELELAKIAQYYEAKLRELNDVKARETAALRKHNEEISAALTLKYNPVYETAALGDILGSPLDTTSKSTLAALRAELLDRKFADANDLSRMQTAIANRDALIQRLRKTPYTNSVPSALAHVESYDRFLMKSYEGIGYSLLSVVQARDATIRAREDTIRAREDTIRAREQDITRLNGLLRQNASAYDFYVKNLRENGIIVDPSQPARIAVYMNPIYPVNDGDLGLVFRLDDQFIGTIRFSVQGSTILAAAAQVEPNKAIQPFDKILIKRK